MKKALFVAGIEVSAPLLVAAAANLAQLLRKLPFFARSCTIHWDKKKADEEAHCRDRLKGLVNFDYKGEHFYWESARQHYFDLIVCIDVEAFAFVRQALGADAGKSRLMYLKDYSPDEEIVFTQRWDEDNFMKIVEVVEGILESEGFGAQMTSNRFLQPGVEKVLILSSQSAEFAIQAVCATEGVNGVCAAAEVLFKPQNGKETDAQLAQLSGREQQLPTLDTEECAYFDVLLALDWDAYLSVLQCAHAAYHEKVLFAKELGRALECHARHASESSERQDGEAILKEVFQQTMERAHNIHLATAALRFSKTGRKFLITSDMHGNPRHAETLAQAVSLTRPDAFVYLGDLSPVRQIFETSAKQFELGSYVCAKIAELNVPAKFIMPGNTDFRVNIEQWKAQYTDVQHALFCQDCNFVYGNTNLLFLSTVAATTHCLKDSEALERGEVPFDSMSYVFQGTQFGNNLASDGLLYGPDFAVYSRYSLVPKELKQRFEETIYSRLQRLSQPDKQQVVFSHGPPYNTVCDVVASASGASCFSNKSRTTQDDCSKYAQSDAHIREAKRIASSRHVGSQDLRTFLEESRNVKACFSGHIHQAAICTGTFSQQLGACACHTVSNTGIDFCEAAKVWYLLYDIDTGDVTRLCVECPPFGCGIDRRFR